MSNVKTLSAITHALKEWAVAVNALEQGKTIVLLRKGGIHERGGQFTVAHRQVLLYPTFEHQKPELLKPEYAALVEPVSSGWHPETVRIGSWAEVTHIFQVTDAARVAALLPYHVWNTSFVTDRLNWQPNSALYVLLLRTHQLHQVHHIPYQKKYGGCKSWIDLVETTDRTNSTPILSEAIYTRQSTEIEQALNGN
jgi:hypothetical protein